jgi:hypothetical protein
MSEVWDTQIRADLNNPAAPLHAWTKATLEDPIKAAKHKRIVTFYVGGEQLSPRAADETLEANLPPLVGGGGVVKIAKYDSNPALNPQPPAQLQG